MIDEGRATLSTAQRARLPGASVLWVVLVVLMVVVAATAWLPWQRVVFNANVVQALDAISGGHPLPASCTQDGIVSYTGVALLLRREAAVNKDCLPKIQDESGTQLDQQPLLIAAATLLFIGLVVLLWRRQDAVFWGAVVLFLVAALLFLENVTFFSSFSKPFHVTQQTTSSEPVIGLWVAWATCLAGILATCAPLVIRQGKRAIAPLPE